MAYQHLLVDRRDHVATLTLNRPDAYNAFDLAVGREIFDAALELDEDPAVRCIVIAANGKAFCGGGDVKAFAANLDRIGVLIKELTTYLHGAISRLCRSDKPVVTAVNGMVAGGGLGLALCGDLVVAGESARFTMAYSQIAASPDGGSSYLLTRLIGVRRAMELYLTNRIVPAAEALALGMVTRVVPDADLTKTVQDVARGLAQGPTKAYGQAKRLFHQATWESLETQMELEAQAIAACGHTEDFRAGVTAFASKQKAAFQGR
jgi:2-(1,2-epoxy-1,2-dihydrophenyl)acetyl-CoA isomerase